MTTTSINVYGFIEKIYQIFSSTKPNSRKEDLQKQINDLFDEFCQQAENFSNKEELIFEAKVYKDDAIEQLDKIINKINNHFIPLDKERI